MKILREHIKDGRFKRCYLLYGEERFLCRHYKNQLRQAITGGDDMNYSYYEGRGIDTKEVIDTGETLPFFAERRLIIIEDSGFFKNSCDDAFVEYVKNLPEYLTIIFVERDVDARNRMYKAVSQNGYVAQLKVQTETELKTWVIRILNSEHKQMDGRTLQLFLEYVGTSMDNIRGEIEKLVSYTMGRDVITREDVQSICSEVTENKVYDMVACVAMKKQKEALDKYYDLLSLRERPMNILYKISRLFNEILVYKELEHEGYGRASIVKKMKLEKREFMVDKYKTQGAHFTPKQLKEAISECVALEEDFKRGRIDEKICVEMIIVKYSSRRQEA